MDGPVQSTNNIVVVRSGRSQILAQYFRKLLCRAIVNKVRDYPRPDFFIRVAQKRQASAPTTGASEHTSFKMRPNQSKLRLPDRSSLFLVSAV